MSPAYGDQNLTGDLYSEKRSDTDPSVHLLTPSPRSRRPSCNTLQRKRRGGEITAYRILGIRSTLRKEGKSFLPEVTIWPYLNYETARLSTNFLRTL